MKSASSALCIVFLIFVFAGSCKKSPSSSSSYTADSLSFRFQVNGFNYNSTNIVSNNPDSPTYELSASPICVLRQSLETGFAYILEAGSLDSAGDFLNIQISVDPTESSIGTGTFSFAPGSNPLINVSQYVKIGGTFAGLNPPYNANWSSLLSDTVSITKINNGLASGTFSATLGDNASSPSLQLHIVSGSFNNVPLLPITN